MVTTEIAVVFGLVAVTLVLFVTEVVPPDTTAVGVLVSLAALERWFGVGGVGPADALSGFASGATLTILAMYVLSEGVRQTGLVDRIGAALAAATRDSDRKLLAATVGTTGLAAGLVNNTPVVAVFIPMVTRIA